MSYLTSDEREDEEIIRSNLHRVPTTFRETISEDTLELRRNKAKIEQELEIKDSQRYAREVKEAQEKEKRLAEMKLSAITNGRHKLLKNRNQTLFEDAECQFCDAEIKKPLKGWNGFSSVMNGFVEGSKWDSSYVDESLNHSHKHVCPINIDVLSKQIIDLQKQLNDYKIFADGYII